MPDFEGKERRSERIAAALAAYGLASLEAARELCVARGFDPYELVRETQPISFENARWAYVLGAAIALQRGNRRAADAAEALGLGLQAFCVPGSVADRRDVGLGHGRLAARLLSEESRCFCFLAGHESFAAAEGALKLAAHANRVRREPLRVVLNGLGKDPAYMIARLNGFNFVKTEFDRASGELRVVGERRFGDGTRGAINCYGSDDVVEAVAVMHREQVDLSITGNSTNAARFQHAVAGTYKKERTAQGLPYFSVASGGGTGRTMHPDNVGAGPASYGLTDTLGRMHCDAQFAGSSSVPAHVEMMGLIGMGNNPMVGASVAIAVAIEQSFSKSDAA